MLLYPAIDLYEGKAVRLLKGEYQKMTVYSENPAEVAKDFQKAGASCIHLVDLEGAKFGTAPNLDTIARIIRETNLFVEVGGGIRSMEVIEKYLSLGVNRVILGTAAVTNRAFLEDALRLAPVGVVDLGVDIFEFGLSFRLAVTQGFQLVGPLQDRSVHLHLLSVS